MSFHKEYTVSAENHSQVTAHLPTQIQATIFFLILFALLSRLKSLISPQLK